MPRSEKSESAPMPGQTETPSSNAELAAQLEAIQPAPAESVPTPASVKRGIEARNMAKVEAEDPTALHEGEQASRVQDMKGAVEAAYHSKRTRDGWETRREHEAEARAAVAATTPESAPAASSPEATSKPEPEADTVTAPDVKGLTDALADWRISHADKTRNTGRENETRAAVVAATPESAPAAPSAATVSPVPDVMTSDHETDGTKLRGSTLMERLEVAQEAARQAVPPESAPIFEATRSATEPPAPDVKTRDQEPASFIASKQEAATMAYAEKTYTDPSTMLAAHDRAGQSAAEAAVARLAEQGTPITVDLSPNPEIARLQSQAQIERDSTSSTYRSELGKLVREATVGEPGRVFRTQLTGADQLAYSEDIRTALGANKEPFIMSKDRKTHTQFYRTADDDTYIFERYDKKTNLLVEQTVVNGKERDLFEQGRDGHFKPGKEIKQLKKEGELSVDYARQKLDQGAEKMTYKQASGELGFAAAVMARRGADSSEITRLKSKNAVKPNTRGFWSGFFSRF